ncbi:MAG: MoaD/ThiS family protein [Pseudomonadota bacterium]
MKITLKFFSTLADFLPAGAEDNVVEMEADSPASVQDIVNKLNIPLKMVHMTLVNGAYVAPGDFASRQLKDGDALAMWPPLAGG